MGQGARMSIVPKEVVEQLIRSFDEKERRAYVLWKDAGEAYYEGFRDAMDEAASETRALLKGGESDGQN